MTFADWKNYWKKIHWTRKWFPIFILLRPVSDNFYYLKKVSPLISPLYIMGVLLPILIFMSFKSKKFPGKLRSGVDEFMRIWGVAIFINCAVILFFQFSIENFGNAIKYISPPLVFFYARRFVQSKEDIMFILQTFLYSCLFPFAMLSFETFVHPLNPEFVTEGRGGGYRVRGAYGDCMNYAIYIIGAMLIYSYFFLDKVYNYKVTKVKPSTIKMIGMFLICLAGIMSIRHVSSWSVFIAIIVWLLVFNSKNVKGLVVVLFFVLIIGPFFAQSLYDHQIRPLIGKEINVMNGDADIQYSFNGRMSRWEKYFEIWSDMPVFMHVFGVSFSSIKEVPIMVGGGMHSDYVRMIFLSGIFGLVMYILFLLMILRRKKYFKPPERFLILATLSSLVLYSVSTLPMIYMGYLNFILPVFAFALLPKWKAYPELNPANNGNNTAALA